MSNLSKDFQNKIYQIISEYMADGHSPYTSRIADHVKGRIGIKPSRTTIGKILRELGYEPIEQPRFVWRHKQKGE